jgi:NtrC-family two-component system response regulator AlgB
VRPPAPGPPPGGGGGGGAGGAGGGGGAGPPPPPPPPPPAGPLAVVSAAGPAADALDADLFGAAGETGADPHGRIARCRGGTLVIDRVGDLPLPLQPKILRLITDRQYERPDDARARAADVRLIATTTDDLAGAARAGTFREDLRLALDVVRLELPPLRQRPRDVPLLAERYLAHAARQLGRALAGFAPAALAVLSRYAWPGNLRELRNVVERAALVAAGERVEAGDLPPDVRGGDDGAASHMPGDLVPLRAIEDQHIRRVLATVGNARAAAAVLGIDPSTLWRRLRTRPEEQPIPPTSRAETSRIRWGRGGERAQT